MEKHIISDPYPMTGRRHTALFTAVLTVLFTSLLSPSTALSQGNTAAEAATQLLKADLEGKRKALAAITQSSDARVGRFLQAYLGSEIYLWNDDFVTFDGSTDERVVAVLDAFTRSPLDASGALVKVSELGVSLSAPRRLRRDLQNTARIFDLLSDEPEARTLSATKLGDSGNPAFLGPLEKALEVESDSDVRFVLEESVAILRLQDAENTALEARLDAARTLGEFGSSRAAPVLIRLLDEIGDSGDQASTEKIFRASLSKIESYEAKIRLLGYIFSGVSLGSILILMALGLSIIFGQMGVINMAHGEMMMVGAYATFWMHEFFVHYMPEGLFNVYFLVALPFAFLVAAAVGFVTELVVVRHLYGRPLETLLATWGVSLVLIQAIRLLHGDNSAINNPTWLRGGAEVLQNFVLPYNRCFIIVLCLLALFGVRALMNRTRFGLRVRATVQNRDMADSLGVRTRRVDGLTFAFGAGLAGTAGYALTLIGGITPDMGQNYIVDSFLVVVTGGVGELIGTVGAGMGLGVLNKFIEPSTGAVWGKVLILAVVIVFIQWRPEGLFPPKGRVADV